MNPNAPNVCIEVKNGHMNKGEMAAGKYSCPMEHLGYTLK